MFDQINAPAEKAIAIDNTATRADSHDAIKSLSDFNAIFKPENKSAASLTDMQTGSLYGAPQQGEMGSPNNLPGRGDGPQSGGNDQSTESPSAGGQNDGQKDGQNDGTSDGKGDGKGDQHTPPPGSSGFDGKNLDGKDLGFAPPPSHKIDPKDISIDKKDVPADVPRLHQGTLPHFELRYE